MWGRVRIALSFGSRGYDASINMYQPESEELDVDKYIDEVVISSAYYGIHWLMLIISKI